MAEIDKAKGLKKERRKRSINENQSSSRNHIKTQRDQLNPPKKSRMMTITQF